MRSPVRAHRSVLNRSSGERFKTEARYMRFLLGWCGQYCFDVGLSRSCRSPAHFHDPFVRGHAHLEVAWAVASTMRVLNVHWLLTRRSQATQRPCRQEWLAVGLRHRVDKDGRFLLPPQIPEYVSLFCIVCCFCVVFFAGGTDCAEPCFLGSARLESHYLS